MYNVQFKFIRGQRVRVVAEDTHKDEEFEIVSVYEDEYGRCYGGYMGPPRRYCSYTEDELELANQPVDLTQPAEVEAAKVGS